MTASKRMGAVAYTHAQRLGGAPAFLHLGPSTLWSREGHKHHQALMIWLRAAAEGGRAALQEVLLKGGRDASNPAHVVGMVRQAETVEVANFLIDRMGHGVLTAELLQPDELVSGIIAQACHDLAESALWTAVRRGAQPLACMSTPVEARPHED